jgi:class 3 adenylate cyclase
LKIIAKINKYDHILKYGDNSAMKEALPNYKVEMGFGLHQGWSIEGAIGSIHKIDASYLSPNVNMASRLEAATKQFGVPLLLSGEMHCMLTDKVQDLCREIDCVTVKGSILPVKLFTVDVDADDLKNQKYSKIDLEPRERK